MALIKNPIICALDTKDTEYALNLSRSLSGKIGAIKLGLGFFIANGPGGIRAIAESKCPIFLDLKLHDIPNTVAEAIKSAIPLNVQIMTIHTSGGPDMMRAASRAAKEEADRLSITKPLIVGVTVLTSMDDNDLRNIGVATTVKDQVINLSLQAKECGLDGIVCSAHEVSFVKEKCGGDFKTIVPGIRPALVMQNDQKRVMTPKEAVDSGADYLVIGRPITKADNPLDAVSKIMAEIE